MHRLILGTALVGAMLMAASLGSASGGPVDAAFIQERCVGCHDLARTCNKIGKKDLAAWEKSVSRMVDAHGANIVPATPAQVAAYLFEPSADLLKACGK
ncbi:MAG: hypothetical protein V3573_12325 [Desulfovibrionaceae bacterium]